MPKQKIDESLAKKIRAEIDGGTQKQFIARRYGCSLTSVANIGKGVSHSHLQDESLFDQEKLLEGTASAALLQELDAATDHVAKTSFHLRTGTMTAFPKSWEDDLNEALRLSEQTQAAVKNLTDRFRKLIQLEQKRSGIKKSNTRTAKKAATK